MSKLKAIKRIFPILLALMLTAGMVSSFPVITKAENFLFITDIKLAAGVDAYDELEEEGYNVMTVGLNAGVSDENQVYIGYKLNDGSPVTNIIIARDDDESIEMDGFEYERAGDVDVDEGASEESSGYLYFTRDKEAGDPIVGLDILRADYEDNEEIYAIPNDGAEIVRDKSGAPADLEQASETITIYLAQIRDGLVKPYISEIALFTGEDKGEAVTKAAVNGYNYYLDGDIDDSAEIYSVLAYVRTASPENAITNIMAVSSEMAQKLEDSQIIAGEEEETTKETETTAEETTEEETTSEETTVEETTAEEEPETESEEEITEEESETETEEEVTEEEITEEEPETETEEEIAEEEIAEEEAESESEEVSEEESNEEEITEEESDSEDTTEEETTSEETTEEETITEETTEEETEPDETMTAAAVEISGCEYVRISNRQVDGTEPYYLYVSKDPKAGNPITMLYVGDSTDVTETFLSTWGYGYFSSRGTTNAYSYIVNEDLLEELKSNMEVYIKAPVYLLSSEGSGSGQSSDIATEQQMLKISMLTAKEGLPEGRYELRGMRKPTYEPPQLERDELDYLEENDQPASAFSENGLPVIIIGAAVILIGIVIMLVLVVKRKKSPRA